MSSRRLDMRPKQHDLATYAGDSYSVTFRMAEDTDFGVGMIWEAHVRSAPGDIEPDAVLPITPPAAPGDVAVMVIPSQTTRDLISRGRYADRYQGFWDIQVADPAGDPVVTLVRGVFTVDLDVTRAAP